MLDRDESPEKEEVVPDQKQEASVNFPDVNLPLEPDASDGDSLEIIMRMPLTGDRVRRRFMKTDLVQTLYDYVDWL